ncbi:MAG: M28 family metallopeptidase [Isosphaerales bacterium]
MTDASIRGKGSLSAVLTPRAIEEAAPARLRGVLIGCAVFFAVTGVALRARAQEHPKDQGPRTKDQGARAQESAQPDRARLRQVVELLASREFGGRSGAGGEKTAAYLTEQFRGLKLEPLFDKEYVQPIPGKEPGTVGGRNVGARLRGRDPALRDQWVIVSAHFDHLGVRRGRLYPGADDNASGVAMMLEVARSVVQSPAPPRRSMIFIGFDLEEIGLFGSRYYVAHPPVPLEKVVLFVTADMIGRSLAGVCPLHVFVIGSEHAPGLRPWIDEGARGRPLTVGLMGADLLVLNRSDYGPFRSRGVPFLFFTTGENPRYHTPADTADTLDYPKLTAISRMIHQVVLKSVNAPTVPRWQSNPDHPFAEAVTIRDVLRILSKNSEPLKIGGPQLFLINNTLSTLDGIVARGAITPDERGRVIQAARIVLFTVL